MNGRKLVTGALAAFVVAFPLSLVWHLFLMGEFYDAAGGTMRDQPLIWSVVLGYVVVAVVMAYMYPKGYEGGSPVTEGLKFGATIGLLWWLPTQLVLYGAMEGPFSIVLVDGGWHLLEEGLAGVALGMVYARGSSDEGGAAAD